VAGYACFNDGTVRDIQARTRHWTLGKNCDATGAFGPWMVTADELPPGAAGLRIESYLCGEPLQSASTGDMIFSVARVIALLTEGLTRRAIRPSANAFSAISLVPCDIATGPCET
ncbi:MAG: fumarylacetoacetate hydrolase family protein, partial [Gaiellaceae bacterium]